MPRFYCTRKNSVIISQTSKNTLTGGKNKDNIHIQVLCPIKINVGKPTGVSNQDDAKMQTSKKVNP